LPVDAFGIYTVAYTSLYVSNTLQSAMIAEPHAVLSASRLGRAYVDFTTSTGVMQLGMSAITGILAVVVGFIVGLGSELSMLILALGFAAVGWQLQEFCRRVLYVESRHSAAFGNDVVSYGGQLVAVGALAAVGGLSAVSAILAIGATSFVAAAAGAVRLRPSLQGQAARSDIWANLRFGKWLAASELTGILSVRVWAYLVAAIAGAAAAGTYGAALLIFGPINVIVFSVSTVLPIRLSRARVAGGDSQMMAMLRRFHVWTVPPVVAVCLAVAVLADPISNILFQGKYPAIEGLVTALAVFSVIRYLQALAAVALLSAERTLAVFVASLVGAVLTLALGWWLVGAAGAEGAALGAILATAATLAVNWWTLWRRQHRARVDRGSMPTGASDGVASAVAVAPRSGARS
jgi:O-antigen/teichoic acid export membrane protein